MGSWSGIDEFVAVAQARSFSQAAKRLGCSTSQISREVALLEDRLRQRLLYRTTRRVSLTEAGERFLLRCRRLVEDREDAFAAMLEDGDQLQGQLRMTCSIAYGERLVVPLVSELMIENPRLSIDLILTDDVLDLVDQGIDLAIRFGKLRDSRLVALRLASRTRHLCASPAYLETHGRPESLEDLAQHVCLRGSAEFWAFSRGGRIYMHRPQGPFRCNSGYAARDAALRGLGLCRLPDFYVHTHLNLGALVELLPQHRPEDEGVWAVYPDRTYLPLKVKATIERLRRGLGSGDDDTPAATIVAAEAC